MLEVEVNKFVWEIRMRECKANGMRAWCLVMHNREKEWVGYYWKGIGNDSHRKYAETWSGSLLAHLCYFLLHCGIDKECINKLIRQSFDYNEIVDVANAVQNEQGKFILKAQALAE